MDLYVYLLRCTDADVAIFRATISGCSEPNPVKRDLDSCRFSPLPDRNGRKLVDDRAERHAGRSLRIMTLQGAKASIRNPPKARCCRERPMCRSVLGWKILVNGCSMPYTSAEIPPAGAPSGFDSAAVLDFIA